jgi:hypothetical protein
VSFFFDSFSGAMMKKFVLFIILSFSLISFEQLQLSAFAQESGEKQKKEQKKEPIPPKKKQNQNLPPHLASRIKLPQSQMNLTEMMNQALEKLPTILKDLPKETQRLAIMGIKGDEHIMSIPR